MTLVRRAPLPEFTSPAPLVVEGVVQPLVPVRRVPCDGVFATAVLSPNRVLAVMYWARYMYHGKPLVLCDYEVSPLRAGAWELIDEQMKYWARDRLSRMPHPAGLYVESEMIAAQASGAGIAARPIPPWLTVTSAWNQVVQSAAGILSQSLVGQTSAASDRMKLRPFITEAGIAAGLRDPERPEIAAYLYGVVLALDPVAARNPRPKMPQRSSRG